MPGAAAAALTLEGALSAGAADRVLALGVDGLRLGVVGRRGPQRLGNVAHVV